MGIFKMSTEAVHAAGVKINEEANAFDTNLKEIKKIVDTIVSSEYCSPEARDIANEIASKQQAFNNMRQTLENYGNMGIVASNITEQTSDDISSMIN